MDPPCLGPGGGSVSPLALLFHSRRNDNDKASLRLSRSASPPVLLDLQEEIMIRLLCVSAGQPVSPGGVK